MSKQSHNMKEDNNQEIETKHWKRGSKLGNKAVETKSVLINKIKGTNMDNSNVKNNEFLMQKGKLQGCVNNEAIMHPKNNALNYARTHTQAKNDMTGNVKCATYEKTKGINDVHSVTKGIEDTGDSVYATPDSKKGYITNRVFKGNADQFKDKRDAPNGNNKHEIVQEKAFNAEHVTQSRYKNATTHKDHNNIINAKKTSSKQQLNEKYIPSNLNNEIVEKEFVNKRIVRNNNASTRDYTPEQVNHEVKCLSGNEKFNKHDNQKTEQVLKSYCQDKGNRGNFGADDKLINTQKSRYNYIHEKDSRHLIENNVKGDHYKRGVDNDRHNTGLYNRRGNDSNNQKDAGNNKRNIEYNNRKDFNYDERRESEHNNRRDSNYDNNRRDNDYNTRQQSNFNTQREFNNPHSKNIEYNIQDKLNNLTINSVVDQPMGSYVPPHMRNNKGTACQSVYGTFCQELFDESRYFSSNRTSNPDLNIVKTNVVLNPINTFNELVLPINLHEYLHEMIPTPVQGYAIPAIFKNRDIICRAPTGVGKTLAFLIPLILKLETTTRPCLRILVLAPTRELALQIEQELDKLLNSPKKGVIRAEGVIEKINLRFGAIYGGTDIGSSRRKISPGVDVLIATPGRLCDFIDRGYVDLKNVKFFVLDEADRMLEMGFERDMDYIKRYLKNNLTYMFSATFDARVKRIINTYLKDQISIEYINETLKTIKQEFVLENHNKDLLLRKIIESFNHLRILIFVETKRYCRSLEMSMKGTFNCTSIHGDKCQIERESSLKLFKSNKCNILVATSVAARGLDIQDIDLVINYDMPRDVKEYIHRIGRSGRNGKKGWSISFWNRTGNRDMKREIIEVLKESGNVIPEFL